MLMDRRDVLLRYVVGLNSPTGRVPSCRVPFLDPTGRVPSFLAPFRAPTAQVHTALGRTAQVPIVRDPSSRDARCRPRPNIPAGLTGWDPGPGSGF